MAKLGPGDAAPNFRLLDQTGNPVQLEDFGGCQLLVRLYPEATTTGRTRKSCSVNAGLLDFRKLWTAAVCISPDELESRKKFQEEYSLGFPLLSDADDKVARLCGAVGPKNARGAKKEGIIHSSFLIDEKGGVIASWYQVKPEHPVPRALEALKSGG